MRERTAPRKASTIKKVTLLRDFFAPLSYFHSGEIWRAPFYLSCSANSIRTLNRSPSTSTDSVPPQAVT